MIYGLKMDMVASNNIVQLVHDDFGTITLPALSGKLLFSFVDTKYSKQHFQIGFRRWQIIIYTSQHILDTVPSTNRQRIKPAG